MDPNRSSSSLFGASSNESVKVTAEEMNSFKQRIRSAFNLFDLSGSNAINKRDIGTLIRYLGFFPSQQDIVQTILPKTNELIIESKSEIIQSDVEQNPKQNENEIDYAIFEKLMLEIMKQKLYPSDDEDTVLMAFKVIQQHFNKENGKIVYKNDIISAMKQVESSSDQNFYCLDERELDDLLNIAIITTNKNKKNIKEDNKEKEEDNDDDVIYYEDYVDELFYQLRDHA